MEDILLEVLYFLCGLVALITAFMSLQDKNNQARVGTGIFWVIVAITFMFGKVLPPMIVGLLVVMLGILTVTKQVSFSSLAESSEKFKEQKSQEIGSILFVPAVSIALLAFGIAQFTGLNGLIGLGIGAIVATLMGVFLTKAKPSELSHEGSRLLQLIGAVSILPQLLAALGSLFNEAQVGKVISQGIYTVVPEGNLLFGVIAYCIGMAVFTMIMGNAFAAFAVITAGIGVPFVLELGADPIVVGALGMTAGFCGTLLTPMAANFNIVPVAILEMDDKNKVIKTQMAVAFILLAIHIALMMFWAF
ncbi:DUF979 domain-containing protein [Natranaerobius trueperi]|uniref:Permease n=1 Tax=Natranaerobius trueperi TaxID=759412 RepID=A0A226C0V4_9FIRM|nr:DUF979 domain-containing protein [Natranaerobius trueperi]OWZ84662.1 hypothetical protein CDO51_02560 [Natranaerobius trueperi]